jgi:hypothetical protein
MHSTNQLTTLKEQRNKEANATGKRNTAIAGFPFARACATLITTTMSASLVSQTVPYDSAKPLSHATLFAPGIISIGDYESHATFTPDGREIYFSRRRRISRGGASSFRAISA